MKIALIGYGKMGRVIEKIANTRGHEICTIIDPSISSGFSHSDLQYADIAIEFTTPATALNNFETCFKAGIPVVSGTTGWLNDWDKLEKMLVEYKTGFFYASNFSLGLNLTLKFNEYMAKLMSSHLDYSVHIEEIHHVEKLDAPSGTAIKLSEGIEMNHQGYLSWILNKTGSNSEVPIFAIRDGDIPGTHSVHWA
ncbi:MAG: 4-hydroxy-tetrahydrodipicolinate reductase, partial [Bacteroidales bacterium]|nr:4-hydroxy-tetrahydrodipicolinate reductase [Bacteroidales bacterium]